MNARGRTELPPPDAGRVDLLVVAAEHSGDEHASRVVRGLLARRPDLRVAAVGGRRLKEAGAQLLYDLTASSAMGFAVIRHLAFYRALISRIIDWVGIHRPRAVCFVDSSGLNLRIARGLFERGSSAKAGGPTRTLYYISPQVWASRAGRRFEMARFLDGLAAIFPFEPAVYADTGLPVSFVGHPFVAADHSAPFRYDPSGCVLLLPGSRKGVVSRIFPVLVAAFCALDIPRRSVVIYPSEEIARVLRRTPLPDAVELVHSAAITQPVAAAAVLTASGTMSMDCALAGIPGAIVYRTDPLTYAMGRMLVRVRYLGIANLLLNETLYPEFIQGAARPEALSAELRECIAVEARRARTAELSAKLREVLNQPTGISAVDWLERQLA